MDLPNVPTQQLLSPDAAVSIWMRREDLLHPVVSGNKFRKLKYNLEAALLAGSQNLLTFGGAHSNHIAAVAFAGKNAGLRSTGMIRGEELNRQSSPTLAFASACGMQLSFVSRADYKRKEEAVYLESLRAKYGAFYLIPEGGTNALAVKGCEEILSGEDRAFDYIACSVGTGGTISGLIRSALPQQQILGFPALKGGFLQNEILKFAAAGNWRLISGYEFGGYAKVDRNLVDFINAFQRREHIPLDPVYTGKMVFGVMDMARKGYFRPGSRVLLVHTGGLQGVAAMNAYLKNKNLPILDTDV